MSRTEDYSRVLVEALEKEPAGLTRIELENLLGHDAPYVPNLVHHVRNVSGAEIVVTSYDYRRGVWVYRLGQNAQEAQEYVRHRMVKVRSETQNLVNICDRTEAKYPGDYRVMVVRHMLEAVVHMLDSVK